METIGERLKRLRFEKAVTQQEVANLAGVSKQLLYKYENNIICNIPSDRIEKLAFALGTTPAYLMGWEDSTTPSNIIPIETVKMRPLIGTIACGDPILAQQNINRYMPVPDDIRCDFLLRCQGDSMIDAGISDGDLVYLRQQDDVDDGDIAAVLITDTDTEATLKRVYHHEKQLTLMPANTKYSPIVIIGDALQGVRILGKAIAVTRKI